MQDPEPYLEARGIEVRSLFDDTRAAILDVDHRTRVNYELFYFADEAEVARFRAAPLVHCGIVTDPVTYKRFRPRDDSPRVDYNNQPFFFESEMTRMVFAALPDSFLVPKYKMPKINSAPDEKKGQ